MKHDMKQILISIFFAFAVSILCFYAFHETFPPMKASDISEHKFFVEQLEIPSKKIDPNQLSQIDLTGHSGSPLQKYRTQ